MRRARPVGRPRAAALRPLLLLALVLWAAAAARAETVWVDGYALEVTLRPAKVVPGEPVTLRLQLDNRADTDLELLLSGEEGRGWPDGFEISVAGPDGAALQRVPAREGRAQSSTIILRAGQSLDITLPPARWARFERPGLYTVTYRRGLRAAAYDGRRTTLTDVSKPAVEFRVRAQVEVSPGGEARLGRLIEELGAALLNPAPDAADAAMQLATFDDERVVRHFVEAYRRSQNVSVRNTALRVCARFESDLALEGLRLGAADPGDDFRTAAASALSQSRHPEAARVLAGMRYDPRYGVRLVVLYALEQMESAEARLMLWEMTSDRHEGVGSEALRIVQTPTAGLHP